MGKQDKQATVAPAKSSVQGPNRKRRNSFQRKSLSKAMKRQFAGCVSAVRGMLVKFEQGNKARTTA